MVNDSNIITIDSIESKMKVNKFSGNHSQKTREGYNLWDYLNVVKASAGGLTIEKDYENGYIIVNGTPNENYVYISSSIFITDILEDGQRYTLWQEIYGGEGTTDGIYLQVTRTADNETTVRYYSRNNSASFLVDKSNNASYSITLQTSSVDGTGTLTNYRNRYMLYKGTDEKSYELPGASPSLDYPSEVKTVGDNVNILPNEATSQTEGELEWTVNTDGSVHVVGTASSNALYLKKGTNNTEEVFRFRANKQYKNVGNVDILYQKTDGAYARKLKGEIFEYEEDELINKLYLQIPSGETVDETYYPKIVEYHEGMDESYSPYGQGSVEVKKINKNWFNVHSSNSYGVDLELQDDGSYKINGTSTTNWVHRYGDYIWLTKGKYTISAEGIEGLASCIFGVRNDDGSFVKQINPASLTLTFEVLEDIKVRPYFTCSASAVYNNNNVKVMLEKSEAKTEWAKHEEESYVLYVQREMLQGDYFVKEADGWKEVHIWEKDVLTGNENIVYYNAPNAEKANTFDTAYFTIQPSKNGMASGEIGTVNSNMFKNIYSANGIWGSTADEVEESIAIDTTIRIRVNKTRLTGYTNDLSASEKVELFKQLLQQKNTEGNPVYAYYRIVTPTKLACTEEQITVLNELQNIILYDDTTNIVLPDIYPILDYDVSKIIDTTITFEASLDSNGYFVVPDYDIKCLVSYSESDIPSMPEAVETAVSVPGRDGDIPLNTTYNPIPFNIVCYTEDNLTPEEKYAEETKMNKFLNSIKNNTIKLKLESKGKYYDVKYNGQLTTINYPKHLQFNIPLKSSSSYAKDIEEYYILGNGEKESDTIKEVGAVFVIEGPAQTPKISLNDYEMFYDNVLLFNTKLVIDSNKSTVTMINREGTATNAMRYYNHEFPKIQNGNNVLKVLSGIDEDRQVNVRWFDLKL